MENSTLVSQLAGLSSVSHSLASSFIVLDQVIDGAFCATINSGGVRVIFRNKVGSYVEDFARKISHVTNPKMVEVLVARDGVGLALQRSWHQIILDVTTGGQSYRKFASAIGLLIDAIKLVCGVLFPQEFVMFVDPSM